VRTITTDRLRAATTEHDLIALVREYLSEWLPEELASFPIDCRPQKLRDAEDLGEFALQLTRACVSFDMPREKIAVIEEMEAFVGQALQRMAQIERATIPTEATARD